MKKIIYILVFLVCVSLVSGYLGTELVTCGNFDCGTDINTFWSDLGTASCQNNWINITGLGDGDVINLGCGSSGEFIANTSQDISFKAGRSYNVTLDVHQLARTNLKIFVSDNITSFSESDIGGAFISSWIAKPTVDGNLTIEGHTDNTIRTVTLLNSISVKEIIEIKEYQFIARDNNQLTKIFNWIRRIFKTSNVNEMEIIVRVHK